MKNFFSQKTFALLLLTLIFSMSAAAQKLSDTEKPTESYRIKAGDKLSVKFLNHPELNEPTLLVRPDGFVSLQMIDDLKAEGLTAVELRKKNRKKLR
jgi:polysaccharide export outer membrane protein